MNFYMDEKRRTIFYKRMIDLYRDKATEALQSDDRGSYIAFNNKYEHYKRLLKSISKVV